MAEPATKPTMPPYIAFKTLNDIIERMEREEPPTRVDPTYLDSYAGGYRPTVIGNLQTMGLLTKSGQPTDVLLALVTADEPARKDLIGELLKTLYADVFALGLNSTQGQFVEIFTARGAQGDTRRKAISFFLKACAYAGVPTGTHWKTPAVAASGTRKIIRRRPSDAPKDDSEEEVPPASNGVGGEVVTVDLGDAGKVVVAVDVKWLQLDDATFVALREAIKDLKALAAANKSPALGASDADHDDEEEESS